MLPDRDLDDLLSGLVDRIKQQDERIAALERQEFMVYTGRQIRFVDDGIEAYIAVKFTAQTPCSRGQVVCFDQANTQRVIMVPTSGNMNDMPIGVATETIGAGSSGWIAICGLVYVRPETTITAAVGYVLYCSTTALQIGRVNQAATVPVAATHFKEVGHWYENGSGAGALARAIIHFN